MIASRPASLADLHAVYALIDAEQLAAFEIVNADVADLMRLEPVAWELDGELVAITAAGLAGDELYLAAMFTPDALKRPRDLIEMGRKAVAVARRFYPDAVVSSVCLDTPRMRRWHRAIGFNRFEPMLPGLLKVTLD